MMEAYKLGISHLSALLVALLNWPQVRKVYLEKSARDLALGSLILHLTSSILWISYGTILNEAPIIWANVCYLSANLFLLYAKFRYNSHPHST